MVGFSRSGVDLAASRPRSCGSHSCSHVLFHEDRASLVQSDAVAALPFALTLVSSHVPVRPSNRLLWPPPGCMCEGRSAWAQGVCSGKRGGAHL